MRIIQFTFVVIVWGGVIGYDDRCSKQTALLHLKRPAYDFSIKLLQRVTEDTDSHFVFSPLSTWLQLSALAEGATGTTFQEIWNVTRHYKNRCFKRELSKILVKLNTDLRYDSKRKSVIAIDKLIGVKHYYVRAVQKYYGIKVMLVDFSETLKSANAVNKAIEEGTGGVIDQIVYYDDFINTLLLMSDANYFTSEWKLPFNRAYPKLQPFYSSQKVNIGKVSMMNRIDYYNYAHIPHIYAKILEIPCATSRISMLIFMPTIQGWIGEIFYSLQHTRLRAIFNLYRKNGKQLMNVTMPIFTQRTETDNLPELVYDMGITKIFNPETAEFKGITNYKMYAALMTQVTDIKINETSVTASTVSDFIKMTNNDTITDFLVDRPFAYMIVDKSTELIIYAGVYSVPSAV